MARRKGSHSASGRAAAARKNVARAGKAAKKSSSHLIWLIVGMIVVIGLLVVGIALVIDGLNDAQQQEPQVDDTLRFHDGVFVDDVSLGGLTYEEGLALVQQHHAESAQELFVTLRVDDERIEVDDQLISASDVGYTHNIEAVVRQAMTVGRDEAAQAMTPEELKTYLEETLMANPVMLTTEATYDEAMPRSKVDAYAAMVTLEPVDAKAVSFDPAAPAGSKLTCEPEQEGVAVNPDTLFPLVKQAFDEATFGEILVPLETVMPEITVETLKSSVAKLATFSTTMTNNSNRITNIKLACSFISGTVINPGEVFSYNQTVGERTAARGFKEAGVIVNGVSDVGLGGGVCQVSGTLYNAMVMSDMEIVERRRHSYVLGYMKAGTDATVDWGNIDLKMKNTHDTPLYLHMYTDGLKVVAEVYGAPLDYSCKLVSNIVKKTEPGERQTIVDSSLAKGEVKTTSAHTGHTCDVYKVYYDQNGNETKRVKLYTDVYPPITAKKYISAADAVPSSTPTAKPTETVKPTPTPAPTPEPQVPTEPPQEPTQAPTETPVTPPEGEGSEGGTEGTE